MELKMKKAIAIALLVLGAKYNVELPITQAVKSVIQKKSDPREALLHLFLRARKSE